MGLGFYSLHSYTQSTKSVLQCISSGLHALDSLEKPFADAISETNAIIQRSLVETFAESISVISAEDLQNLTLSISPLLDIEQSDSTTDLSNQVTQLNDLVGDANLLLKSAASGLSSGTFDERVIKEFYPNISQYFLSGEIPKFIASISKHLEPIPNQIEIGFSKSILKLNIGLYVLVSLLLTVGITFCVGFKYPKRSIYVWTALLAVNIAIFGFSAHILFVLDNSRQSGIAFAFSNDVVVPESAQSLVNIENFDFNFHDFTNFMSEIELENFISAVFKSIQPENAGNDEKVKMFDGELLIDFVLETVELKMGNDYIKFDIFEQDFTPTVKTKLMDAFRAKRTQPIHSGVFHKLQNAAQKFTTLSYPEVKDKLEEANITIQQFSEKLEKVLFEIGPFTSRVHDESVERLVNIEKETIDTACKEINEILKDSFYSVEFLDSVKEAKVHMHESLLSLNALCIYSIFICLLLLFFASCSYFQRKKIIFQDPQLDRLKRIIVHSSLAENSESEEKTEKEIFFQKESEESSVVDTPDLFSI